MSNNICVISTVGQSVFGHAGVTKEDLAAIQQDKLSDLRKIVKGFHDFPHKETYLKVMSYLESVKGDVQLLRDASAELKSIDNIIDRYGVTPESKLYFLASATPDGVLSARILSDFCNKHYKCQSEVIIVRGIQVDDETEFRRTGLRNLVHEIYKILRNHPKESHRRFLNPTAGFKPFVSYMTIIGTIREDVDMVYIYETSKTLMRLEHLPLQWAVDAIRPYLGILYLCSIEDAISHSQLIEKYDGPFPPSEHPFWSLIEVEHIEGEKYYASTGLALVFIEDISFSRPTEVWLSQQSFKYLTSMDRTQKLSFAAHVEKLKNAIWREGNRDGNHGATILKASGDEKIYYFEENDRIVIAEFARHSDRTHEKLYAGPKLDRNDYKDIVAWESINIV